MTALLAAVWLLVDYPWGLMAFVAIAADMHLPVQTGALPNSQLPLVKAAIYKRPPVWSGER